MTEPQLGQGYTPSQETLRFWMGMCVQSLAAQLHYYSRDYERAHGKALVFASEEGMKEAWLEALRAVARLDASGVHQQHPNNLETRCLVYACQAGFSPQQFFEGFKDV